MAEPQPSKIQEGDQAPAAIPGSNKSETAALNSLDNQSTELKSTNTASAAALGKAMKNLNIANEDKPESKNVKVDIADVVLLAENLDVSRARATELLKANDADPVKAMRAWVAA
ncbi:hypothetical protein KCU86_g12654, partial [Aureobasidium melanogenum]